ncbi:MAG: ferredoxin [Patescibacteria group bacterium]|nr:ferredoxin [Patescibacteria group bacterium]
MKPKVNKDLCIGCGACVNTCSEVFELNSEGKSQVRSDANFAKNKDCIEQAATACPAQAITIEK